ncbi:hypothetical protein TNCV_1924191 [Trichonephila clavipes]|nr:hypothetical protein TNCV_1924191 [Trichonephila clavipes]
MAFIPSNNQNEICSNLENRRNRSCNYAFLSHPLNQSGDSYPLSPNHIRPHLKFSIWDRGTLRVPFLSDDQRLMGEGKTNESMFGEEEKKRSRRFSFYSIF